LAVLFGASFIVQDRFDLVMVADNARKCLIGWSKAGRYGLRASKTDREKDVMEWPFLADGSVLLFWRECQPIFLGKINATQSPEQ
jgi:hypothetical protein